MHPRISDAKARSCARRHAGDVYRVLGRTAEAKADYDKALSIYKDNKTAAAGLKALGAGAGK